MGLREEATAARPYNPAAECRIAQVLRALSDEDAADLRDMLTERTVDGARYVFSANQIIVGLRSVNIQIGDNSISRHRRGECRCR